MASANMMMWGSVDEGKSIFADDRVRPAMEALAKKLYWQPSTVSPQLPVNELPADTTEQDIPEAPASTQVHTDLKESFEFIGPVEGRVVRGADNKMYAVDFLHLAPIDVAWQEAHEKLCGEKVYLPLRRTAVLQWVLRKAILENQKDSLKEILEKVEKGEKVEGVEMSKEDIEKAKKSVEETEKERGRAGAG